MVLLILLSLVSLTWAVPGLPLDRDLLESKLPTKINIPDNDYRLSTTTVPSKYDLVLNVPRECLEGNSTTYSGFVKIVFSVSESKKSILIHSLVDIINITALDSKNSQSIEIAGYNINYTTQIVNIQFANNLLVHVDYELRIYFTAELDTKYLRGFYKNEYTANGAAEYLVTTQFEATDARRAFPCFDEPQYKAIFGLTLIYPTGFIAAANVPVADSQTETDTNTVTTIFEDTPVMSSYLLAFTISKYNCSTTSDSGIVHDVCTRRDFASQRELALEYGVKFLNALGRWTELPYDSLGIKKMDQYSFVSFSAGAMENWGLVTYQEYALVYSPEDTSNLYKQGVLVTVAHEFSHMWFGDFVTTKWWDSIFLNEGFASYFEYFILDEVPELTEMEMDKQFIIKCQVGALQADANPSSASLTSQPSSPVDVMGKFSAIAYNKGGSIIRMVENTVGTVRFKKILHNYLVQQSHNWSTPDVLWTVFSNNLPGGLIAPDITFLDFIDNWTNRPGYPVINATVNGNDIVLTQQRFLFSLTDDLNTTWYVPVVYTTSDGTNQRTNVVWLQPNNEPVILKNVVSDDTLVIINIDSLGYYIVNYEKSLRDKILAQLEKDHTQISDITRAKIIHDIFSLAAAGFIDFTEALTFLNYLEKEDSYYPWYTALNGISFFKTRLGEESNVADDIDDLLLKCLQHLAVKVPTTNWDEIDHVTSLNLANIWNLACSLDFKQCVDESNRLFGDFRDKNIRINSNIRSTTYCYGLANSKNVQRDYDFLQKRLENTIQPHEREYLAYGIGCSPTLYHINRTLEQSIDPNSIITRQEFFQVWTSIFSHSTTGLNFAFDYFILNHKKILDYAPNAEKLLTAMASKFTTERQVYKLQKFIGELDQNSSLKSIAESALTEARKNIQDRLIIEFKLQKFFDKNKQKY